MKKIDRLIKGFISLVVCLVIFVPPAVFAAVNAPQSKSLPEADSRDIDEATKISVQETYGRLPLYFIENKGQIEKKVKYYEKGSGHATYFTKEGIYLSLLTSQKKQKQTEKKEEKQKTSTVQKHNKKEKKETEVETIKLTILNSNKALT